MTTHPSDVDRLARALDVTPRRPALYERALTHRSDAYERGGAPHNERLEFLGDAVLGLVVTDRLYRDQPEAAEGRLAKLRAATVSEPTLARVARRLGLGDLVRLGRGEDASGGRDKDSILADALEAVIGAVYLDRGLRAARRVVLELFGPELAALQERPEAVDAKTALQELLARQGRPLPRYEIAEEGPDHDKRFLARAHVEDQVLGSGRGRTKKEAEQGAAAEAVAHLRASEPAVAPDDPDHREDAGGHEHSTAASGDASDAGAVASPRPTRQVPGHGGPD